MLCYRQKFEFIIIFGIHDKGIQGTDCLCKVEGSLAGSLHKSKGRLAHLCIQHDEVVYICQANQDISVPYDQIVNESN